MKTYPWSIATAFVAAAMSPTLASAADTRSGLPLDPDPDLAIAASQAPETARRTVSDEELDDIIRRAGAANSAFMNGDIEGFLRQFAVADDFTLMAPFGGPPTRGFDVSSERLAHLKRYFAGGESVQELVGSYASADLVVLAVIERQHAWVGGLPKQDWSLRVTLVYRREGSEWLLVHRHADPLVKSISLEQAAEIARR